MAEMSPHCMQANTFKSKSSQWVAFTCLFAADEMHVAALTLYYWPSKHSSHSDQNSLIRLGFAVHVPFQLKVWKADLANLKNENKVIRLLWFLLHKSNHKKIQQYWICIACLKKNCTATKNHYTAFKSTQQYLCMFQKAVSKDLSLPLFRVVALDSWRTALSRARRWVFFHEFWQFNKVFMHSGFFFASAIIKVAHDDVTSAINALTNDQESFPKITLGNEEFFGRRC